METLVGLTRPHPKRALEHRGNRRGRSALLQICALHHDSGGQTHNEWEGDAPEIWSALFAEDDVLSHDRVELLQFETLTSVGLVLGGPVLKTGACRRTKLDDRSFVA